MKPTEYSLNKSPGAHWQILGQLELPVTSNADNAIRIWLTEILGPLKLPADLINKILKSAQYSTTRIIQIESLMKFEHIHIIIFVPLGRTSKAQTWGFFRIEKIENAQPGKRPPEHAIEFYLYVEGE